MQTYLAITRGSGEPLYRDKGWFTVDRAIKVLIVTLQYLGMKPTLSDARTTKFQQHATMAL
jgi:hypothetical protein